MKNPVVIRSHGGRARAIARGDIHIDVAFLGAPSSDECGNINGTKGKATCGSLGYAMIDAKYADQVVAITDSLMPYPNTPISIPQTDVDYVVQVDAIGDPTGIAKGATRFTKKPEGIKNCGVCGRGHYQIGLLQKWVLIPDRYWRLFAGCCAFSAASDVGPRHQS